MVVSEPGVGDGQRGPPSSPPSILAGGRRSGLHGGTRLAGYGAVAGEPDSRLLHPPPGTPEDRGRRAEIDRSAGRVEREHEVRERPGLIDPVLDEHDRGRRGRGRAGEPFVDRSGARWIQVRGWLVEDED